ncbi:MAG: hypothetical protein JNN08_22695 [Bryobacterales bacterium]|nr:hypothetical protein [Bryobacterales bacterium]
MKPGGGVSMSEIADYIREASREYLANEIDADAFRQAFAGAYHYVRTRASADDEANQLASRIMTSFAEFAGGHRDEESFRKALVEAVAHLTTI